MDSKLLAQLIYDRSSRDIKERVGQIAVRMCSRISSDLRRLNPPPSPEEIEEVQQNTFIKLIIAAPGLGPLLFDDARMRVWILTTAYREWVNHLRQKKRHRTEPLHDDLADDGETSDANEILRTIEGHLPHVYALRDLIDGLSGEEPFPRKTPPGRPTLRTKIGRLLLAIDDLEEDLSRRPLVLPVPPAHELPTTRRRGASA